MAAKKKKKAAKKAPSKKTKKTKKAKKTTRKAAKAKKPAKKSKKTVKAAKKAAPRKAAKKAAKKAKKKKKQIVGEGDYQASRAFLKDQSGFVKKNKDKIPALGKEAEAALEGPQGDMLREAEATAAARSRDIF